LKSINDPDKTASRLTAAVSSHENPVDRIDTLTKFISGYEPVVIGPVLGAMVADASRRIESALTFLSFINRSLLRKTLPDWGWSGLDDWFAKTRLDEAWNLFDRLPSGVAKNVIAKISMLIEIYYILIQDDLLDPDTDMECTGADIALMVLNSKSKEDTTFRIKLSSFPVELRKFLKDILSEFDFIEKNSGIWQFTFSQAALEKFSSGSNLIAHMGAGQMSLAVAQRNAENLVKRLELLLKTLQMFPSGHPSIDPSTESFLSVLSKFQNKKEPITLSVMGDTVMVNDIRVERKTSSLTGFIRGFVERKMSSLTFEPGIEPDDVKTFARLFNRPPAYILEHGGMEKLLEARRLNSISVNRFHYQLISGNGEADQTLVRDEVTIEDAIFSELIDRLERGESIDSLPGNKIGNALKHVLAAAKNDKEEQRSMIARFVVALDPSLLEEGLLSNRVIQKEMAWKAIRKIIDRLLSSLLSPDPDTRHKTVGKLQEMALLAVERGKENSTIQIIENISTLLKREQDPDVLYRGVILTAILMEALLSRGMMSIALQAGKILMNLESMHFPRTELEAARKRSLAEAQRKMDTMEAAETLVQRILSDDEVVSRDASRLAMAAPPDNLVSQLVNTFNDENRRLRSRAFRMLLKLGNRGLSSMHARLTELVTAFNSKMEGVSYSLPDEDWFKARNIIQILRDIGSPSSESILAELCKVPDHRIRRECLLALVKVSSTTAESLSMYLIMDKSKEVADIALDILTKRAMRNPVFIPKITEAFRKNADIRPEILESFSILGSHKDVMEFLTRCLREGPSGMLFTDSKLISSTFRIISRHGGANELPILEDLLSEVEGGFFKKSKIDKQLVQQLKEVIRDLRHSESVIEGDHALETPGAKVKKPQKQSNDDDEITILGPDYGINN